MTAYITEFTLRAVEISTLRAGELKFMTAFLAKFGFFTILKPAFEAYHF
jgi:hypothetical protein